MRHELSMEVRVRNKMIVRFMSHLAFSLLVVLSSCEKDKEPSSTQDSCPINGNQKEANQTIRVTTAEEFIQAIGPNRTIEVDTDEFILSYVKDRYHKYVRWDLSYSNSLSILIRNVKHLTIKGRDNIPTRFLVKFANSDVLNFENCHDVALHNLALGHTTETNDCDSGVVCIQDSTNISFHHCDLFGCGTEGLYLREVDGFVFKDSIIRDCSVGIMHITSCKNIRFENAEIRNNKEYYGVVIRDCLNVLFRNCIIKRNKFIVDCDLFNVVSSSGVYVKGGIIENNIAKSVARNPEDLKFEGTQIQNNEFQEKPDIQEEVPI